MSLARQGIPVELYTDAGISAAVEGAYAVVLGADAVGPRHFINKVGTGAVCARAAGCGVPAYVLAGREKIVGSEVFEGLSLGRGAPDEVWDAPPEGVEVQNNYFEHVTVDLIAAFVTDVGVLSVADLAQAAYISVYS